MKRILGLITMVYGMMVKLFPSEFQEEFGDEIQGVFATMVRAAAGRSKSALAVACLQEFRDFPILLLREYLEKGHEKFIPLTTSTVCLARGLCSQTGSCPCECSLFVFLFLAFTGSLYRFQLFLDRKAFYPGWDLHDCFGWRSIICSAVQRAYPFRLVCPGRDIGMVYSPSYILHTIHIS